MKALDESAIQNLRELGQAVGKNLLLSLTKLYKETTPEIIDQMLNNLSAENLGEVAREVHSLKSSSSNIGVNSVANICQVIENGIIERKLTEVEVFKLVIEMKVAFEATQKDLDELIRLES